MKQRLTISRRKLSAYAWRDMTENSKAVHKASSAFYKRQKDKARSAGLNFTVPDTATQQAALSAALTLAAHKEEKVKIARGADISVPTLNKYVERLTSPGKEQLHELVKANGRPKKYPVEVDAAFVEWAEDEGTPLNEKTIDNMISKYLEFMKQLLPDTRDDLININGLRQHLNRLKKQKGWTMVKPKTMELKRCAIYYSMKKWFEDKKSKKIIN